LILRKMELFVLVSWLLFSVFLFGCSCGCELGCYV
jgi:hypothetical protein